VTSPIPPEPLRDLSPVTFRCPGCDHTYPLPYGMQDRQDCPKCGQPAYAWEHNGNRWNTLRWGTD
jgi:hypothetical protein